MKNIVLELLEDDKPEVRIQASQVLGGLLHCQFIPSSQDLLVSSFTFCFSHFTKENF